MIYVIALRQAARTCDRWQVLPRAYYSVCEALADARRARLRFPLLDFRVARRPTAEKLPSAHAAGVMPARREKPTAPRRGLFSAQ